MAAAREVTPYIRLRSGFAMIKKRSGDGAGPAMELEDNLKLKKVKEKNKLSLKAKTLSVYYEGSYT